MMSPMALGAFATTLSLRASMNTKLLAFFVSVDRLQTIEQAEAEVDVGVFDQPPAELGCVVVWRLNIVALEARPAEA